MNGPYKDRVFIIAEIGCNFEGDLEKAGEMIRAAALAGADAVKFQTFIPSKLASRHAEKFWEIEGCPGKTQLDEFKEMPQLNFTEYENLKKEAEEAGIIFFSTPSDEESADMLERLGVPLYKISSMDITHLSFLKHVSAKGKPVIISTGASEIAEIKEAVNAIKGTGNNKIALLQCTSNYPVKDENVNLRMIEHLKEAFPGLTIGYSDHTIPQDGEGIIAGAVALGAKIIEKHFTFDNSRPGYDHAISADYKGLAKLVFQVRRLEKALGGREKKLLKSEMKARLHARRSLIAAEAIEKGHVIKENMLEVKRPGTGIGPKYIEKVVGKTAAEDIPADTVLEWRMINDGTDYAER